MKKYYITFSMLGLLLGYFAKMNYWFEDEKDIFFPITKEQLKVTKTNTVAVAAGPALLATSSSAKTVPADLVKMNQAELFNELYNNKVLDQTAHQQVYFEMIQSRLSNKYPEGIKLKHESAYEREVANRLGLLRAMSLFWPTPKQVGLVDRTAIKNFFAHVAKNKNENLMVRRQAYKNWLTFGNSVAQDEKNRMAQNADSRLLHLVSLSDENLIESLTDSAE